MQLVSHSMHAKAGFVNLNDFSSFSKSPFCEVIGDELALVNKDFMLVFIKKEGFILVMLQSFMPECNFYINALGEYLGEYLPSIYRQAPFYAVQIGDELKVGVDENSHLFKALCEGQAKPIFENGQLSKAMDEKIQLIDARYKAVSKQASILQRFEELELFVPLELSFLTALGKNTAINGLYKIDENKLLSQEASIIKELFVLGGLELFYHHKASLLNKNKLQEFYYKQNDLQDKDICLDMLYT